MSQAELAEKAGVTITMISSYENNKSTPSLHTLWKIAHALECTDLRDLYGDGGED